MSLQDSFALGWCEERRTLLGNICLLHSTPAPTSSLVRGGGASCCQRSTAGSGLFPLGTCNADRQLDV